MGGNFYEGHDTETLKVFPGTVEGREDADKYVYSLRRHDGVGYDRTFIELIKVEQ